MKKLFAVFAVFGIMYSLCELAYRGRTHISMFFAGGIAAVLTQLFCNMLKPFCKAGIIVKCFACAGIITAVELLTGLLVNVKLKKQVWDYSKHKHNFKGQICAKFACLWLLLSPLLIFLCGLIAGKREN